MTVRAPGRSPSRDRASSTAAASSARTTVISLTAIPLSLAVTALVFQWLGQSINVMTLGGLAIAIGELVDDAVVDVENILRRLKEKAARGEAYSVRQTVIAASLEVRTAIVYATLIIALVFVPLFALPGIEGRLFVPLGIAYIVAILASLAVSVLVTPVLSSLLLPALVKEAHGETRLVIWLKGHYRRTLEAVLASPKGLVAGAAVAVVLAVLYVGCLLLRRPLRGLLPSLAVVFAVSLLAQIVAKIPAVSYYGFESVFFSVLFGLVIRNVWRVPAWMKPAIQGEFFIKIGVVCLGATILFSDVMKSGVFGLVQACLVVAVVWFFAYWVSRRMKVDERTAMILSSGVSICGVSACITAARVAGGDDRKLSYIVSLVLIVVVPMIYLMPWLAHVILPHIFDDPHVVQEVAGAWIGGTIDTTSGVAASSMIVGEVANQHAVIIKAAQNVLIGVVAFFIALYLSTRRGDKAGQAPSLGIVWEKFPKFIIGFVAASLVFSLLQGNGLFTADAKGKLAEPGVAKMFSTVFFSLAFVCVGLDTRLKDIVSRENRNLLWAFLAAQAFNIVVTLLIALVLFGVLKPMLA